jgi:hypothetical protein
MSIDLTPNEKVGSPLYEHFMMVHPEHTTLQESKVKLVESDIHNAGTIEIQSDDLT